MVRPETKKSILTILLLLLITIPSVIALMHVGFFPTHDFIYIARISEMFNALSDGQFPVRWLSGFRYGDPTFNFYAPLPYYLGSLLHFLGLGFLDSAKALFGLSLILSALAMYLLAKELFGKWGGVLSSALYLYAPYRSVDVYVRGALNEAWAFVFFPLIFLCAIKLSKKYSFWNTTILALSLAGLFYTHNIMTILFLPFFGLFCLFLIYKRQFNKKFIITLVLSAMLGVCLAASFLLPALFEKKFVQTDYLTAGYFDFAGHFVAIRQWFDSPWGYGASLWGSVDDMSFQLGVVQWVLILVAIATYVIKKTYKDSKNKYWLPVFLILFVLSLFFQHNQSTFIWKTFSLLAYTQFPWRFLAISVFFASLIGGWLMQSLKNYRWTKALIAITVVLLVGTNYSYFRPKEYYSDSKDKHYMGSEVLSHDDKIPKDYLPIWVEEIKTEKINAPYALSGEIAVLDFTKNSKEANFKTESETGGVVEVPVTFFPGWQARVDGNKIDLREPSVLGLINIEVPAGSHSVEMYFANTPVRILGNVLSVLALVILIYAASKRYKLSLPLLK